MPTDQLYSTASCLVLDFSLSLSLPALFQAQSARLPHLGGVDVHFSGMTDCFAQIVKHKGILSLWNGITANMIKVQIQNK